MTSIELTLHIDPLHPSLAGHFPGQPIVPGVVLLDQIILAIEQHQPSLNGFTGAGGFEIPNCKFLAPVLPGATLQLLLAQDNGNNQTVAFKLQQADILVASGSLRPSSSNDNRQA